MEKSLKLNAPPVRVLDFHGRRYTVNLAFDVVLTVFEVQGDWLFDALAKVEQSLELLIGRRARRLGIEDKIELYKLVMERFVIIGGGAQDEPRALDFEQDAGYILASFRQAYGIDLYAERGRLDWRVFIALFNGLPDDTKIREVMKIRAQKIPERTKHNSEQVDALVKAKMAYALRFSEEEAEATFQRGVNKLVGTLMSMAARGGAADGK